MTSDVESHDLKVPMKQSTAVLVACLLTSLSSLADPLHPFGNDGAWRHEYSGWQFIKQVVGFTRVMAPYTIDGNNDVGVRYEHAATGGAPLSAIVEVYLADSAAHDAKLDGAKASAASTAGESAHLRSEKSFEVGDGIRGVKVTYAADARSSGAQTSLYFFEIRRWRVKVLGSTAAADAGKEFDTFVKALPWDTLGDPTALH
ncbi:MAG: hypothetical protein ABW171_02300 [Steroidobacter sp.]